MIGYSKTTSVNLVVSSEVGRSLQEVSATVALDGEDPPRRRRKWRRLEARIRRLKLEYNEGPRNIQEYCGAIVRVIKNYTYTY
jgi:hypothetical protein